MHLTGAGVRLMRFSIAERFDRVTEQELCARTSRKKKEAEVGRAPMGELDTYKTVLLTCTSISVDALLRALHNLLSYIKDVSSFRLSENAHLGRSYIFAGMRASKCSTQSPYLLTIRSAILGAPECREKCGEGEVGLHSTYYRPFFQSDAAFRKACR